MKPYRHADLLSLALLMLIAVIASNLIAFIIASLING